jgi:predicted transcriptional regulator of viral defense system
MASKLQSVERLARTRGSVRARDLMKRGLPTIYLARLVEKGRLVQQARGVYAPADLDVTERHDWELACTRVPGGVLCLLTALAFHGIGTQSPRQVWMAIANKAWQPRVDHPPLRFVRFSGAGLTHGIVTVRGGVAVLRVYSPAKTVADCFKFRQKIGLDVAVEALREGWREKKFTLADLTKAAEVCRVRRVMQPYLEMLT